MTYLAPTDISEGDRMTDHWERALSREPLAREAGTLIYAASVDSAKKRFGTGFFSKVVDRVYADHDRSHLVRRKLDGLYRQLAGPEGLGLNFGSGRSPRRDRIVNLDVYRSESVDVVYDGVEIPFKNATFDLIVSQEVFEHIREPAAALEEVARVAKAGAVMFLQLPFILGYHSKPDDFWRFTKVGIEHFVQSGGHFELIETGIAVGHGTALHRILVEFMATTFSALSLRLYRPAKLAAAVGFYWLKLFDYLTPYCKERDRIPGGYYVIARRSEKTDHSSAS